MKYILPILFLSFFTLFSFTYKNNTRNKYDHKVNSFAVVQLFTSQGCSSCPSADNLLGKIKEDYKNENIAVLSYHVDYWNRLGWKDPFSKKEFTLMQQVYGFVFNNRNNYTPQAVVNGKIHFVGSDENKMKNALNQFLLIPSKNKISISEVVVNKNQINFRYQIDGVYSSKELKVALVIDKRETSINRGENQGKVLINRNIVVNETSIRLKKAEGLKAISIPKLVENTDSVRIICYLQDKDYSISGAIQSNLINLDL